MVNGISTAMTPPRQSIFEAIVCNLFFTSHSSYGSEKKLKMKIGKDDAAIQGWLFSIGLQSALKVNMLLKTR